jgi:hypothetical protein
VATTLMYMHTQGTKASYNVPPFVMSVDRFNSTMRNSNAYPRLMAFTIGWNSYDDHL